MTEGGRTNSTKDSADFSGENEAVAVAVKELECVLEFTHLLLCDIVDALRGNSEGEGNGVNRIPNGKIL